MQRYRADWAPMPCDDGAWVKTDDATAEIDRLVAKHEALEAECNRLDEGWHEANGRALENALEAKKLRDRLIEAEQDFVQALLSTRGAFPDMAHAVTAEYLGIRDGRIPRWPRPLPEAPEVGE